MDKDSKHTVNIQGGAGDMYQRIVTGFFLTICSVTDVKRRCIYNRDAFVYFILAVIGRMAVILHLFLSDGGTQAAAVCRSIFAGLIPGGVCFLVSWLGRQGLGYGDSVLILICGISLGFWTCMWITFTAFFWAGIWAVILLVKRSGEVRKRAFPFVPFLLLGYVIQGFGGA